MTRFPLALICASIFILALPAAASAKSNAAPVPGIALGAAHSCALADTGAVLCWTEESPTPTAVAPLEGVEMIAATATGTCALHNGGVSCWTPTEPTPVPVEGVSGAYDLVAGDAHVCAVSWKDGVKCWGDNSAGQLGANGAKDVKSITASAQATCLRTHSSKMPSCFGAIAPIPEVADTFSLVAGGAHGCLLSWSANGVTCWGDGMPDLSSIGGVDVLGASKNHSCAVAKVKLPEGALSAKTSESATANLQCWGSGAPPAAVSLTQVGALSASSSATRSCAIVRGGDLHCWAEGSTTPAQVAGIDLVTKPQYPAGKWVEVRSKLRGKGRSWRLSSRLHLKPSPFVFPDQACVGTVTGEVFYWKKVRSRKEVEKGKKAGIAKGDSGEYEKRRVGVRTSARLRQVGDYCKADFNHKVSKRRFAKQRKNLMVRATFAGNESISAFESGESALKDFKPPKQKPVKKPSKEKDPKQPAKK